MKPLRTFVKSIVAVGLSLSVAISSGAVYYEDVINDNLCEISVDNSGIQEVIGDYLEMYPNDRSTIETVVEEIVANNAFLELYNLDSDRAIETLCYNLDFVLSPPTVQTYGMVNGRYFADYTVPVVTQSTTSNCGIASIIQALIGDGIWENTFNNRTIMQTVVENQANQIERYGSTYSGMAYQVADTVNYYANDEYYIYYATSLTENIMLQCIKYSLQNGYCPIVHIDDTSYFEYYDNRSYQHWVTVSAVNDLTHTVTVVDPFNDNLILNQDYNIGGTHTISFDEFLGGLGTVNGYVVALGGGSSYDPYE